MLEKCDSWKLLQLFFRKPHYNYHFREICRLTNWSPIKVKVNLELLLKKDLIIKRREKNLVIFTANINNENYKKYKQIYNLEKAFKISDILENQLEDFEAIVFFGSASRGEDSENSDFDFCIIGGEEKEIDLKKIEKEIERKISLYFFKNLKDLKKNKELLNNLINGFVIKGYFKVF
jgi:predicted nucleotidyltransferase